MVTDLTAGGDGRLKRAASLAGLLLFYAGVCLVYQLDSLFAGIIWEDAYWIRNPNVDHPLRVTQNWIMHDLGLRYISTRIILFRVVALGLHALNAWLLSIFFLLFLGGARGALRCDRVALVGGALLAGLLFCVAPHYAVTYLSALSYQLVITFMLGAMIGAVLYFARPNPLYWALVAGCYLLALHSHSFALPLPFFIVLLEAATRRGQRPAWWRWIFLARYALLLLLLGGVLWLYMDSLPDKGSRFREFGFAPLRYLELVGELYARAVQGALLKPYLQVDDGYLLLSWVPLLALALIAPLGLRNILNQGRALGLAGALLLFFFAWSGFAFPMEMGTRDSGLAPWRYYYHASGGALLLGYLLARLISLIPAWLPAQAMRHAAALPLLFSVLVLALAPARVGANLSRIFSSKTRWELPHAYHRSPLCPTTRPMTLAQVEAAGGKLRCADLRGLSLVGLDLTGADLRGANLTGVELGTARMEKARLDGAALLWVRGERSNFKGANLQQADLSGAALGGSNFAGCNLRGANLRWVELGNADLHGADLKGAFVEETVFNGADLRGVDFTKTRLLSIYLEGADLRGAKVPEKALPKK